MMRPLVQVERREVGRPTSQHERRRRHASRVLAWRVLFRVQELQNGDGQIGVKRVANLRDEIPEVQREEEWGQMVI